MNDSIAENFIAAVCLYISIIYKFSVWFSEVILSCVFLYLSRFENDSVYTMTSD